MTLTAFPDPVTRPRGRHRLGDPFEVRPVEPSEAELAVLRRSVLPTCHAAPGPLRRSDGVGCLACPSLIGFVAHAAQGPPCARLRGVCGYVTARPLRQAGGRSAVACPEAPAIVGPEARRYDLVDATACGSCSYSRGRALGSGDDVVQRCAAPKGIQYVHVHDVAAKG